MAGGDSDVAKIDGIRGILTRVLNPTLKEVFVTIGRAARRAEREEMVESVLGEAQASAGLDLLELTEYAWHDVYGEITPPDDVILNILICSRGALTTMIHAAHLAVQDSRDLQLWAEKVDTERQVNTGGN